QKSVEEAMGYCMRKAELLRANHDKFSEVAHAKRQLLEEVTMVARAKRQLLEEVTMVLQAKVRAAVQQQGGGSTRCCCSGGSTGRQDTGSCLVSSVLCAWPCLHVNHAAVAFT
ncbi:unnamed protein product, partial [Closterium sp. NIES-64]